MTETTPLYTATAPGHEPLHGDHRWHHHKKRFSWQPIFAGIAAALAVQVVLGLIGIGLGFGMNQGPNALPWRETPPIGALMWAGCSILASAFYGGFIASRLTKSTCHHEGVLSGIVAWAGSVLVVLYLIANSYGTLFGGASQLMGHFASTHAGSQLIFDRTMTLPRPPRLPRQALNTDQPAEPLVPGAPMTADTLNHQELTTPPAPPAPAFNAAEIEAARQKAALAAGVVLLLAGFVSALGGSLGTAHVKHDRERHLLAEKKL